MQQQSKIPYISIPYISWSMTISATNQRHEPPGTKEKEALAEGGNAFVRAASELADAWEKMEDPMDRAYARSIAECTAMNYMDMVEEKLDEGGQEPATGEEPERGAETAPETAPELAAEGPLEDLLEDLDLTGMAVTHWGAFPETDPDPEELRARNIVQETQKILNGMLVKTEEAQEAATGQWLEDGADPDEGTDPQRDRLFNETAIYAGNAAALRHHMARIRELEFSKDESRDEAIQGHALAIWPCQQNLRDELDARIPGPLGEENVPYPGQYPSNYPMYQQAIAQARAAMKDYESWEIQELLEEGQFPNISLLAEEQDNEAAINQLLSELFGTVDDSNAAYCWCDDQEEQPLMGYRYQGQTYIKELAEPYGHPIDARTILKHCNRLEMEVILIREGYRWGAPGRANTTPGEEYLLTRIVEDNLTVRAQAIAELNLDGKCTDLMLDDYIQGHVRDNNLRRTLLLNMSAQSETAARDYGPGQKYYAASNPLSRSATQAVIQAARAAGEPEEAVRELGRRLNLNEVELLLLDLSPPEKIKTEDALEILKQAYELRGADSFWYDMARTMGLDPESEQIQKLAEQLREDENEAPS